MLGDFSASYDGEFSSITFLIRKQLLIRKWIAPELEYTAVHGASPSA